MRLHVGKAFNSLNKLTDYLEQELAPKTVKPKSRITRIICSGIPDRRTGLRH